MIRLCIIAAFLLPLLAVPAHAARQALLVGNDNDAHVTPLSEARAETRPKRLEAAEESAGKTFRDCADCPEMVGIPAGRFDMGSPRYETGRGDDEGPQHSVSVPAFALGKFEVTRGQWTAFVRDTGHSTGDKCWTFEGGKAEERSGRGWRNPGYAQDGRHPVTCMSWNDAQAYVDWLARKTGKPYRLPSEAEWEYAARAGKYKPNAFGLYDMSGNVFEWTADCYHENYDGAPRNGSAWTSGDCWRRVLRSGSWSGGPQGARSAIRLWLDSGGRGSDDGFRVALSPAKNN